jgi:hypothetical protein
MLQVVRVFVSSFAIFIASLALASRAHAWGCEGHQIVALIARGELAPRVRDRVDRLLAEQPIERGLDRFCDDPGLGRFVDASTWADDVREAPRYAHTDAWHFLNLPRAEPGGDVAKACPKAGCVTRAIRSAIETLQKRNAKAAARADALRFLIHFAGDLHQPLHAADNNDRGGNCVLVDRVVGSSRERVKLHAAWDGAFVRQLMNGRSLRVTASDLASRHAGAIASARSLPIDVERWARESHRMAESIAYGKLPTPIPIEPPARPPIARCPTPAKPAIHLNAAYRSAARDAIGAQLALAGARLARLLDSSLGSP